MALYKLTRPYYDERGKLHGKGDLLHLSAEKAPKTAVLVEEPQEEKPKAKATKAED